MGRYIIRRLLQAIPLLLIISVVLFLLMNAMGDPLASFGGRRRVRSSDRERLTRQLGLDKPITVQYAVWLIGNDWMDIDLDGDGVPDAKGTRRGILRGDWGRSFMETADNISAHRHRQLRHCRMVHHRRFPRSEHFGLALL